MTMKVKITLTGPGGELDSIVLDNVKDETDPRIGEGVLDMVPPGCSWAIGDTLTIREIQ